MKSVAMALGFVKIPETTREAQLKSARLLAELLYCEVQSAFSNEFFRAYGRVIAEHSWCVRPQGVAEATYDQIMEGAMEHDKTDQDDPALDPPCFVRSGAAVYRVGAHGRA